MLSSVFSVRSWLGAHWTFLQLKNNDVILSRRGTQDTGRNVQSDLWTGGRPISPNVETVNKQLTLHTIHHIHPRAQFKKTSETKQTRKKSRFWSSKNVKHVTVITRAYGRKVLCLMLQSSLIVLKQSHDSETWITFLTFLKCHFKKSSHVFGFSEKCKLFSGAMFVRNDINSSFLRQLFHNVYTSFYSLPHSFSGYYFTMCIRLFTQSPPFFLRMRPRRQNNYNTDRENYTLEQN